MKYFRVIILFSIIITTGCQKDEQSADLYPLTDAIIVNHECIKLSSIPSVTTTYL